MPQIKLQLGKPVEIERADSTITIQGIGKLVFSQGSVEWWNKAGKVNYKTFTWQEFADVLQQNGTAKKKVAKPA